MASGIPRTSLEASIQYSYEILCDICDECPLASWSCKECVQNLCETCKKNHLKISYTKNHRILPLLDRYESGGDHVNICKQHQEPILFLCEKCQKEICRECQSGEHKGHRSQGIADYATSLRSEIEKEFKLRRSLIEEAREKMQALEAEKRNYDTESKITIDHVKGTLDSLFKDFRKQAKSLIEDVEAKVQKSEDCFENDTYAANNKIDNAEKELNELYATYHRQPDAGLSTCWQSYLLPKILDIKPDVDITFRHAVFSESQFDEHVKNIKGDIAELSKCFREEKSQKEMLSENTMTNIETKAKTSNEMFSLKGEVKVYSVCILHKEQQQLIWIGLSRQEQFRVELFSVDGECVREKSINFPPLYLLSLQSNGTLTNDAASNADILLITSGVQSSFIRALKGDGFIADFKDVTPFFPFGMCCTSDGNIFVCLQKSEFAGKVMQMTTSGDFVREFFLHNYFTPTRLLSIPSGVIVKDDCSLINLKGITIAKLNPGDIITAVCSDSRGNIFGAGTDTDANEPCIIKIEQKRRPKVKYPLISADTQSIVDITFDSSNKMLLIACLNGSIHSLRID